MKTITLTFETINGVKVGKIAIDGKYIIPQMAKLPFGLTDEEYRICCDMCVMIRKETSEKKS